MNADDTRATEQVEGVENAAEPRSVILQRVIPITALVLIAGFIGLILYSVAFPSSGFSNPSGIAINENGALVNVEPRPVDDFTLELFDGGEVRLSDFRGQGVVLNFWASWCPPCREEARDLERAWQELRDEEVIFLGLNVWDNRDDALEFIEQYGVSYPNGVADMGGVVVDLGVRGLPETFIIDVEGHVAAKFIGPVKPDQLVQTVRDVKGQAAGRR